VDGERGGGGGWRERGEAGFLLADELEVKPGGAEKEADETYGC
jgi:hypothetical protein